MNNIKEYIKKSLTLSAIIIFVVYVVSSLLVGIWQETLFVLKLFLISGLICLVQMLGKTLKCDYYLLELLIEYVLVCIIVTTLGFAFGWFSLHNIWHVFLYVTPVYLIAYFLDMARSRRDVEFINEKIKERMERGEK